MTFVIFKQKGPAVIWREGMWKIIFPILGIGMMVVLFWPFNFGKNDDDRVIRALMNAAHFPAFCLFTVTMFFFTKRRSFFGNYGSIAITCVVVIIIVEFLQPLSGRTKNILDCAYGVAGVCVALVGLYIRHENKPSWARWGYVSGILTITAFILYPVGQEWYAGRFRAKQFPVLGSFETSAELHVWKARGWAMIDSVEPARLDLSNKYFSQGNRSLRIQTSAGNWTGVKYLAGDMDWGRFKSLAFDTYNTGEEFPLHIRIADRDSSDSSYHSRYNKVITVLPGWNMIRIPMVEIISGPKERLLNIQAIRKITLCTGEKGPSRVFFIDHVRLE